MEKIKDLALLSDIFPTGQWSGCGLYMNDIITGFHGAVTAGVTAGSTV